VGEFPKKLLVVEDDLGLQSQLRWCFEDYEVLLAGDRAAALAQLRRHEPPVVILDLGLPPDPANTSEGFLALEEILRLVPETKIVVVTGNDERENALRAVDLGAYDFYQKPIDADILKLIVDRAQALVELEREIRALTRNSSASALQGIIAVSPQMLKVCKTIERIAPVDVTTLLLGESGTGKELLARALHDLSARARAPFVAINCAAIPDTLLESELFGYEKGAFTGAAKQTKGKIEYANGGTLFLDEVGDLPLSLQAKLLRFLQERVIERLGGREEVGVDIRVVCATHRDLHAAIEDGGFRADLFYRISEITINIPPLRDRQGDTVILARTFLERFFKEMARPSRGFSKDALAALQSYAWPGNVRELENRLKRAVIMCEGPQITAEDLELENADEHKMPLNLRQAREHAERQVLLKAMTFADGNLSRAATLLGVARPTLYSLLSKYNMKA
jgi:two-component system NtrC family response regulator